MSAPACANPGADARKLNAKGIIAGSIRKGDADAVESMLEANPELLNAYVGGSSTPVCFACAFNQAAIVEVCIALGADLNKRNGAGQTPLLVAAGRGHIACVEALLRTELSVDIHALSRNGQTAIDVAESRRGHEDACAIAITCEAQKRNAMERKQIDKKLRLAAKKNTTRMDALSGERLDQGKTDIPGASERDSSFCTRRYWCCQCWCCHCLHAPVVCV